MPTLIDQISNMANCQLRLAYGSPKVQAIFNFLVLAVAMYAFYYAILSSRPRSRANICVTSVSLLLAISLLVLSVITICGRFNTTNRCTERTHYCRFVNSGGGMLAVVVE